MAYAPRISLVAWKDRQPQFVFVMVPDERGRYVRTDASVVITGCPHCKAQVGEPCYRKSHGEKHYHAGTHCARREKADRRKGSAAVKTVKPRIRVCTCGEWQLVHEGT